jgi:hypothetical protein
MQKAVSINELRESFHLRYSSLCFDKCLTSSRGTVWPDRLDASTEEEIRKCADAIAHRRRSAMIVDLDPKGSASVRKDLIQERV